MQEITSKPCGACRMTLPITDFYRHTSRPDGFEWSCKACRRSRRDPEAGKRYYAKHRDQVIARTQAFNAARFATDPNTRREIKARYHAKLRARVLEHLGGVCRHCGFADHRALQVDHVHGGGSLERKVINGDRLLMAVLRDEKSRYQLLCANCNWIKRYETASENPRLRPSR